jgi:hypothetical protein
VQRASLLLLGLGGAVALFAYSRTQHGAQLASDAVEAIAVNASRLLPKGLRNNNPGNLRYIARNPWDGQVGDDGTGFGVYSSMALGVRASARQLLKYHQAGLRTVREIISTWAPANENDTAAYVNAVAKALKVAADQRIDVSIVLPELAAAIFRHEVGVAFAASPELTTTNIRNWVRL